MVPELYSKMYEKKQMTGFRRNGIIPKPIKIFDSKFDTKFLKTNVQIVLKFQICIFWTDWELTRQRALRPGRAEPGRTTHKGASSVIHSTLVAVFQLLNFSFEASSKLFSIKPKARSKRGYLSSPRSGAEGASSTLTSSFFSSNQWNNNITVIDKTFSEIVTSCEASITCTSPQLRGWRHTDRSRKLLADLNLNYECLTLFDTPLSDAPLCVVQPGRTVVKPCDTVTI